MDRLKAILVLALSVLVRLCVSMCTPDDTWLDYRIDPATPPVPFNGTETISTSECVGTSTGCFRTIGRLSNGRFGTMDLDVGAVHAWNQDDIVLLFDFGAGGNVRVTGLNLYFYNIPSMRIGLPNQINLYSTSSITFAPGDPISHYTILGNQDLSQDDNTCRNITLLVTANQTNTYRYFQLQFRFSEMDSLDWLLLSEVELCTETVTPPVIGPLTLVDETGMVIQLGPVENIQSNFTLSCSVADEGRFQWEWSFPSSGLQNQQWVVDASRTSIIQLTQISKAGGYDGVYECRATYNDGQASNQNVSRQFTIALESRIQADRTTVPFTQDSTTVTLACELSGYAGNDNPMITWMYENQPISSVSPYLRLITTEDGNNTLILGGGNTQPSLRSILTVSVGSTSVNVDGDYVCQSTDGSGVAQIEVTEDAVPIVTTPSSPTQPPPPASIELSIVFSFIGVAPVGFLFIVIVTMVIKVIFVLRRKHLNKQELNTSGHLYDNPDKIKETHLGPPLPPRPATSTEPNPAYQSHYDSDRDADYDYIVPQLNQDQATSPGTSPNPAYHSRQSV